MATSDKVSFPDVSPSVMLEFLKEKGCTQHAKDDFFYIHCKKSDIPPIKFPKQGMVIDVTVAGIVYLLGEDPAKCISRLNELQSKENHHNKRI